MTDIIATVDYGTGTEVVVPSVGIQGLSASDISLANVSDVDVTSLVNGSVLVYKTDTNKWTSTTKLDAQDVEAGEF